jgi:phage terminase Nu1 subunit (DNA packaging protein)
MPQKSKTIKPLAIALPVLTLAVDLNRLTSKDLSTLLGVAPRTVKDYLDGGAPFYTNDKGVRYIQWSEFFPWYIAYVQSGRGAYKGHAVQGAEQVRLVTRNDLDTEELNLRKIKVQQEQVKLDKLMRVLIPRKELEFALNSVVLTCRGELLRLPDTLATRFVEGLSHARKREIAEKEVNKTLLDMTSSIARLIEGANEDQE